MDLDCGFTEKSLMENFIFFVQGSKNKILIELGDVFLPKHAVLMKNPSLSNNQQPSTC